MDKKMMLLLVAIFAIFQLEAQPTGYAIYKLTGTVSLKKGSEWSVLQKRDEVKLTDMVRIGEKSEVQILDRTSNRIYKSLQSGEFRIVHIINQARQHSDQIAHQVNKAIFENMKRQNVQNQTFSRIGATMRGDAEQPAVTDSVYCAIRQLIDAILQVKPISWDAKLSLVKKKLSDGEFYFKIENGHEVPLCVNLLRIDRRDQSASLCFNWGYTCDEPYILIPTKQSLSFDDYIFAEQPDEDNIVFVLFATQVPFDNQALQLLLKSGSDISDMPIATIYCSTLKRP